MTTAPLDRAAATPDPPATVAPVIRRLLLPAVVAVTVLLSACQGDTAATSPASTTPSISTTTPSAAHSAPETSTPAPTGSATPPPSSSPSPTSAAGTPAADVTIDVVIADGTVRPNAENVMVKEGQTVNVTITSDVDESIHVHGYDQTAEATPTKAGSVTFTADVKGVFEIETHESAKLVAKLIVS